MKKLLFKNAILFLDNLECITKKYSKLYFHAKRKTYLVEFDVDEECDKIYKKLLFEISFENAKTIGVLSEYELLDMDSVPFI